MDHPFYCGVFEGSNSNNSPEYNRNCADDVEKKALIGRLDIDPDSAYITYEMGNPDGTYEVHPNSGRSSNESAGAISKHSKFIPKVNDSQSEDAEQQMKIGHSSKQYASELSGHTINSASDKETSSSSSLMKSQASSKTSSDSNSSGAIRKTIASPSVNYLVHSISPLKKRQSDALSTEQAVLEQSPKSTSLSSLQLSGEGAVGGKISSMPSSSTSYLSQSYTESKIAEPYALSVSNSNNHLLINASLSDRYQKEQECSDTVFSGSTSNNLPKFQRHLFASRVASSETSNLNRNMLSLPSDSSLDIQNELQPVRSRSQASGTINNTNDSPNMLESSSQSNSTSENEFQIMRPPVMVPKGGPVYNWQATLNSVSERFAFLFNNEILSDVQFVVGRGEEEQTIPAHKFVLAVGSAVFDAMFNGLLASEQQVIHLPDVEPQAFLTLLSFLYSDEVQIGPETVMTVLYTAKKYAVPALERRCVDFLKTNLSPDNAFMLLTQARLFDEPQLAGMCLKTIDKSSAEAIVAEGFTDIDYDTLILVLQRDTLRIKELDLYHAVCRWAEAQCNRQGFVVTGRQQRSVLGQALKLIRFPLMTVEEFAQGAAQSNILTDAEVVQLFLYFSVNPKPSVDFIDVPRCCMTGKEQSVNRFPTIEARWGYSGTPDRIRFVVDRRIFVIGFGMYGSIHGPSEFDVTIQLIHTLSGKVCGSNETVFTSDGTPHTFRVMFPDPIEVLPNTNYTAYATLRGPDSHYGTKGLRKVVVECPSGDRVCFQFSYAAGNNNGTSVEDGQIPEIIFYT